MNHQGNAKPSSPTPPNIFEFHDYRQFLKLWFAYLKTKDKKMSLREIAKRAKLSSAYLPLVISNQRRLTSDGLDQLLPHLELNDSQKEYLKLIRTLAETESKETRLESLKKIQSFQKEKEVNKAELETYRYLQHWFYVAIREMVNLPDFEFSPQYFQRRLFPTLSLSEIKEAMDFLESYGYLTRQKNGKISLSQKEIECMDGIFRIALSQFHHEMLKVSSQIIAEDPVAPRKIEGYTMAFPATKIDEVGKIISKAMNEVQDLANKTKNPDQIYHVSFSAIPLTKPSGR